MIYPELQIFSAYIPQHISALLLCFTSTLLATACVGAVPIAPMLKTEATQISTAVESQAKQGYPFARRGEQVDDYHGVQVADPYRWLEDPDSKETRQWIDAQNNSTEHYLAHAPARAGIKQRLTELWDYERYGVPWQRGGHYFFRKNDGLQNQSVLYIVDNLEDTPRVLLDPNKLSKDGTVSLQNYSVSKDGKWLAYAVSRAGSDWLEWSVRNIITGLDNGDLLQWSKFSGAAWAGDSQGFYYSRYAAPTEGQEHEAANFYQKLYYHKLGTKQSADRLVYERSDHKEWGFSGEVTEDGSYLIISVWKGTGNTNLLYYQDLKNPKGIITPLIDSWDGEYTFVSNLGTKFWFKSDFKAAKGKLIAIDITDTTQPKKQSVVIAEQADTLTGVALVGQRFIASYLKDAHAHVTIHDETGTFLQTLELPGLGSVGGFSGIRKNKETFFSYTDYTTPTTIYRLDTHTFKSVLWRQPVVDFDPSQYITTQHFYSSKDGTKIPLFLTHKKGLRVDQPHPTYLYGYGGFNISITPGFRVSHLVWMEMGGVLAVANLRGGGEYGEEWHQAGTKLNKQNVFDDFIGAAEWLLHEGRTTRDKLAIGGRSNGGLLVGACLMQRPELFAAALPGVGVLDMLRFHKFTIGWAWVDDYGSSDNQDEFMALYKYSPYHRALLATDGVDYPATLITTADHDDRVVPAHSFKFAAALQWSEANLIQHSAKKPNQSPVLIRIETKAGHGAGKPTRKQIEQYTDEWAFVTRALGMNMLPRETSTEQN